VTGKVACHFDVQIRLRVGIASGPVTAGIIGTKRFSYDVWGDTVNLAARLESTGEPERVQISREAFTAMAPYFEAESRGEVEIKGLGRQPTWFLLGPRT
jgi:adenylate cyclase